MGKDYRRYGRVFKVPRRPFEKERLDKELQVVGHYGLKNKREVWRVQYTLSKIRSVARVLLTLPENHPKRVFEGQALMSRLYRLGLLKEDELKLDIVLSLSLEQFLDRRLQTRVFNLGLAQSIHHARVKIDHRHIHVGKRMVNIPSFMVRLDSDLHIGHSPNSSLTGGRPGRKKRKTLKAKKAASGEGDDEEL